MFNLIILYLMIINFIILFISNEIKNKEIITILISSTKMIFIITFEIMSI